MTPCVDGLLCEANQLTGNDSVRTARDDPVTGIQRSTHEHAIAIGMQHFNVATFDAEQIGLSRIVRIDLHYNKGRPQSACSFGERCERQPIAAGLDCFFKLQSHYLAVNYVS